MIYVRMIFVYKIKTDRKVGQCLQIELQSLGQKLTYHNLLWQFWYSAFLVNFGDFYKLQSGNPIFRMRIQELPAPLLNFFWSMKSIYEIHWKKTRKVIVCIPLKLCYLDQWKIWNKSCIILELILIPRHHSWRKELQQRHRRAKKSPGLWAMLGNVRKAFVKSRCPCVREVSILPSKSLKTEEWEWANKWVEATLHWTPTTALFKIIMAEVLSTDGE